MANIHLPLCFQSPIVVCDQLIPNYFMFILWPTQLSLETSSNLANNSFSKSFRQCISRRLSIYWLQLDHTVNKLNLYYFTAIIQPHSSWTSRNTAHLFGNPIKILKTRIRSASKGQWPLNGRWMCRHYHLFGSSL